MQHALIRSVIAFLVCFSGYCQTMVSGRIIDHRTKRPIFGAYILLKDKHIATTDNSGRYNFALASQNQNERICISHVAYGENCYTLADFKNTPTIELSRRVNVLEEAVIQKGTKVNNPIIKRARKVYKKTKCPFNHWSGVNLKQLTQYNDTAQSYLEVDGHIFVNNDHPNPFWGGFIVPNQVRRTKESVLLQRIYKKVFPKSWGQHIGDHWYQTLFFYRFFKLLHPLSRKGQSRFAITLDGTEQIGDNEYHILVYRQVRRLQRVGGRYIKNVSGTIWINTKDYSIFKASTSFDFENLASANYTIFYKKIKDHIYLSKLISNNFNKHSNTNVKSVCEFNPIDTTAREDYRELYNNGAKPPMDVLFISMSYNRSYWSRYNIKNNPFYKGIKQLSANKSLDVLFKEGAASEIYTKKYRRIFRYIQSTISNYKIIDSIMKKDLKLN